MLAAMFSAPVREPRKSRPAFRCRAWCVRLVRRRSSRTLQLGEIHIDIFDLQEFVHAGFTAESAVAAVLETAERTARRHRFARCVDLNLSGVELARDVVRASQVL